MDTELMQQKVRAKTAAWSATASRTEHGRRRDVRPNWDEFFLGLAEAASARAECVRRRCGAVVVKNRLVVGLGFNGALPGAPSCLDGACPRGLLSKDECLPGSDYSNCIADHAERNALRNTNPEEREGSTVYVNSAPCAGCQTLMRSMGVEKVVWPDDDEGIYTTYFGRDVQL